MPLLDALRCEAAAGPVLLYAGSCPRCRWMARVVLRLSAGAIRGRALDESEWRRFYDDELPQSRGSPVLVEAKGMRWGAALYPRALWLALSGAAAAIGRSR